MRKNFSVLKNGYTLIEILVAVAVLGILLTIASAIFINTILSTNKANIVLEAKQNASLVADTLERDVRKATSVSGSGVNLTLSVDGTSVTWNCVAENAGVNGYITRNGRSLTNRDITGGVSWSDCSFTVSGNLVTFSFTLKEGAGISSSSQDLGIRERTQVSVVSRGY